MRSGKQRKAIDVCERGTHTHTKVLYAQARNTQVEGVVIVLVHWWPGWAWDYKYLRNNFSFGWRPDGLLGKHPHCVSLSAQYILIKR